MRNPNELQQIFEKQFKLGMMNKDFEAFKRTYPTLFKVILNTIIEVEITK